MTDSRFDHLAYASFTEGRPDNDVAALLLDELLFQRATQTYLWALPLINTLGMQHGSEATFGKGYNVLPIWKQRLDAKTLVTTPNSDVLYAMSYLNLAADGPMVLEAPPMLQGILLDFWQRPIPVDGGGFMGDVGLFGPDGGQGGKFLIVPADYDGDIPADHHVYRSATNWVFVFLRGFFQDPKNLAPAVEHLEQTRLYPLGLEAEAEAMVFPDASGVAVDMLPISNGTVWPLLKTLLDVEGSRLGGPDWLGMLGALGIEEGKQFAPDKHTSAILDRAARTAYKMSRVIGLQEVVSGVSYLVYPDRRWVNPFANRQADDPSSNLDLSWTDSMHGDRDLNARIWFFTDYYSVSPGMLSRTPGKGANYFIAFTDSERQPLLGANSYRLTLPANVPAAIFWSLTLYDAATASGLDNGQPFPSLGSRDLPQVNTDGTTDLYFGPEPPEGQESNWLATVPGKAYFAILRLYGPTEAAFDKTWKPGDLEPRRSARSAGDDRRAGTRPTA